MKLDARTTDRFLRDPGPARAVLLHGEDTGLARERANTLTRLVAGQLDDPFQVATLDRDTHDRLEEEATALSLMGGRRVVRVREGGDHLLAPLTRVLATRGDTLVIIEAPTLVSRSKLRAALESREDAAVIACYPEEGRQLATSLRAMVEAAGCRIAPDALDWLAGSLGADRLASRSEVEKLVLYVGEGGTIDIDAVETVVADASSSSLEDALFAATAGDLAGADRALERAIADGAVGVGIARAALTHLGRLRTAREAMAHGMGAADAARGARPPVFFKRIAAFTRALTLWSPDGLGRAAREANRVELACKQTGAPDLLLVRNFVGLVARQAARAAR